MFRTVNSPRNGRRFSVKCDELQRYLAEWDQAQADKATEEAYPVQETVEPEAEPEPETAPDDDDSFDLDDALDNIDDPDSDLVASADELRYRIQVETELCDINHCIERMKERGDVPAHVDDSYIGQRLLAEYESDYFDKSLHCEIPRLCM